MKHKFALHHNTGIRDSGVKGEAGKIGAIEAIRALDGNAGFSAAINLEPG